MCDLNCANLIDLSLEDDTPCSNTQIKTESNTQPSNAMKEGPRFIPPTWRKRDSLDNNPFDCAQKLVDRLDDPFDVVEKEACLKAKQAIKPESEVKLGNLLSLSNDNIQEEKPSQDNLALVTDELNIFKMQELDLESPPVMLNENQLPGSVSGADTDSNPNSSAESSASAKLKKNMEYRKRLLKLSISNAAFSSPISRKQSLELEDLLGTPVSSMLSRAAEFGEHLLAAESPLKLVEDEDIMSEENKKFTDSEKNFEADLEMLKIPILSELPSPTVETFSIQPTRNSPESVNESCAALDNALPNLEAIKEKLKAKREEINNNHQQEISSLIHNLKYLISSGEMVNKNKKQQASELLESLRSALKPCEAEDTLKPDMLTLPPQPIKRQGTFDIDLQENKINVDDQPLVKEIPNCMVSSSATYDGETAEEKLDLNLPEIAPLSPPHYRYQNKNNDIDEKNHLQTDVNDIMEQLSKLLINNSVDNHANKNNPTFIVVMNANQLNHSNFNNSQQSNVDAKQRSALVATYFENSINDGSPDLTKVNPMARRRTQSLSIHDKVKIVQLPLQPPTPPCFIQKRHSVQLDQSPPVNTTPPSVKKDMPEFKTPARMIRRNSYSSGTPYTAHVGTRRTGFGSDCKNSTQLRRAQTLDTHHEGQQQQQAIVRPMHMPSNNLHNFKPDLKKKTKHNTESIMKSSGPLKATIPVKKVAPMIKMSPPTPDKNSRTSLHNISLQSHSKISRVPTTPLQAKEGVGFPNACSTPASFTSPIKRTTGPINKPRYSYMSTTPNSKSSVLNSSTSTGLKRRSIAEFKSKSPLKPRVSSVGLAAAAFAATSSKATAASSRLSTSAGARISKTPIKTTNANTATVNPTSRLSTRASVGGSALSTRNKENKRP